MASRPNFCRASFVRPFSVGVCTFVYLCRFAPFFPPSHFSFSGGAGLSGDVQEAQRQLRGGLVQWPVPVDRGVPHLQAREQDLRPLLLRQRAPRQGVRHRIHPRSRGQ